MLTTKREKTLAIVLGGSLAVVVLWQLVHNTLLQPIVVLQQDIRSSNFQQQELEQQLSVVDRANADIGGYYCRSLPPDPATASVTYQHWLLNRLKASGISAAMVTPGSATHVENVGYRIPFSIAASASTKQIGEFLDSLEAAEILHRIMHLNVTSGGNVSSQMRNMTLSLEAIAMDKADNIRELPVPEKSLGKHTLLAVLSERDVFQRYLPRAQPDPAVATAAETAKKRVKPPRRPEKTQFVGSVLTAGTRQAWFVNQNSHADSVMGIKDEMALGNSSVVIMSVGVDFAQIQLDGFAQSLKLGDIVHESMKVAVD
jgi:hypothetical protein